MILVTGNSASLLIHGLSPVEYVNSASQHGQVNAFNDYFGCPSVPTNDSIKFEGLLQSNHPLAAGLRFIRGWCAMLCEGNRVGSFW